MDLPPLSALGERIMICGPSNSGKSTLAVALARKIDAEHKAMLEEELGRFERFQLGD